MTRVGVVVVAGGSGSRMGRPKQFLPLGDATVVERSLRCFLSLPEVEAVVVALSEADRRERGSGLAGGRVRVVAAGSTRMGSVRSGVAALPPGLDVVAVHDGARPLVTPEIVRAVAAEAVRMGAAVAAVPVKDTLKRSEPGSTLVAGTPERALHWAAQTPQAYRREILAEALARFPDDAEATDESQLVERLGRPVALVPSSGENFKITTPEDLLMAEAILESRAGGRRWPRAGFGFDIHRLVPGRKLWLAGVLVPHGKGLLGHSDSDAVLHAACDAVLGALGLGEIGLAFPPSDPRFRGLDSRQIVAHTLARVSEAGGEVLHLDCTLIAEEPKLSPHYAAMRESLAALFHLPIARASLKAKSHEGLGAVGRGEAIACHAVATVLSR
ncbi:MAG: 2-C-methyl-D-erythritol 4-phosphate cytidylyltransferase [Elusimicrobia bacterium]|nr:2-C-methyl-D-erythritol 4-phosphate cytidylyltransferase [Elusimicrobiota bacterium]